VLIILARGREGADITAGGQRGGRVVGYSGITALEGEGVYGEGRGGVASLQ